jgi:hypothetical protein
VQQSCWVATKIDMPVACGCSAALGGGLCACDAHTHTEAKPTNDKRRASERLPRTAAPSPRGVIIAAVAADATRAPATYAAISESAKQKAMRRRCPKRHPPAPRASAFGGCIHHTVAQYLWKEARAMHVASSTKKKNAARKYLRTTAFFYLSIQKLI